MVDESMGKNTKVKKVLWRLFNESLTLLRKVKQPPPPKSEVIEMSHCRKRGGCWIADIKVIQNYRCNVPIKIVESIIKREA